MSSTQEQARSVSEDLVTRDSQGQADEQGHIQIVTFEVGDEEFAIDILAVQEIIRVTLITRVPHSPPSVEGVVNFRGQITPVVDLRKRFQLESQERGKDARIVIVEIDGRMAGFVVDRVHEVLRVDSSILEPAPTLANTIDANYVRGVGKLDDRLLILLDLERLLGHVEIGAMSVAAAAAA